MQASMVAVTAASRVLPRTGKALPLSVGSIHDEQAKVKVYIALSSPLQAAMHRPAVGPGNRPPKGLKAS